MDNPIYASQVIRFVETVKASAVGAAAIPAHRVVGADIDGGALLILQAESSDAAFTSLGVSLYSVPAAGDTSPAVGPRNVAVANSGLLIVEVSPEGAPAYGDSLFVDSEGRARVFGILDTDTYAVTVNGSTPTVRDVVGNYAVVSFS